MIRKRQNSQKPDDNFVKRFQKNYVGVIPVISSHDVLPSMSAHGVENGLKSATSMTTANTKESTPYNAQDHQLNAFINPSTLMLPSPSGLYSESHGMWSIFQSQAGDLHTPAAKLDQVTPLSIAPSISGGDPNNQNTPMFLDHLNQQYFWEDTQHMNGGTQHMSAVNPLSSVNATFGTWDSSVRSSSSVGFFEPEKNVPSTESPKSLHHNDSKNLRFKVALQAQTAMVKHPDEVPLTYLNKGQPYLLFVFDSNPPQTAQPVKYRTHIRVSFNEPEQRAKPAACWELWKNVRGLKEARQRESKPLAVEYVNTSQDPEIDGKDSLIQLETSSVDGFSVIWTADPVTGVAQCAIRVRFNFLSTDFNIAKGVKGTTVRLCAKTEQISEHVGPTIHRNGELCYCKVKLFRDHGAERKLHNDIAHVKKTIDKLTQKRFNLETKSCNNGKRNHKFGSVSSSVSFQTLRSSPRSRGSVDSQNDFVGISPEDNPDARLVQMHQMLASNRPVTELNLVGEETDDPHSYPIEFSCNRESSVKSEGLSQHDPRPEGNLAGSATTLSTLPFYHDELQTVRDQFSRRPMKVQRNGASSSPAMSIDAIDIDPTYKPPAERPTPVACFFIQYVGDEIRNQSTYYRATYLAERTVRDLVEKICHKSGINVDCVTRLLYFNGHVTRLLTDIDVQDLPEGQDMIAEFVRLGNSQGGAESAYQLRLCY